MAEQGFELNALLSVFEKNCLVALLVLPLLSIAVNVLSASVHWALF